MAGGDRRCLFVWQAEAGALLRNPPPDPDAAQRLDLRHQHVVTIDDAETRGAPANPCNGVADSARLVEYLMFPDIHHTPSEEILSFTSAWQSMTLVLIASPFIYVNVHAVISTHSH